MVNYIWLFMIISGILTFIFTEKTDMIIKTMTDSAMSSIELSVVLLGLMALWQGIIKVCESSGIIEKVSNLLSGPLNLLFPNLKGRNRAAMDNIVMNIVSNMFGMSNAATPYGIKAMEEMQKINHDKETASEYMITFLILNSATLQFIPSTVMSIRAGLGAKNPSDIVLPTIITSAVALLFGLLSSSILKKIYKK